TVSSRTSSSSIVCCPFPPTEDRPLWTVSVYHGLRLRRNLTISGQDLRIDVAPAHEHLTRARGMPLHPPVHVHDDLLPLDTLADHLLVPARAAGCLVVRALLVSFPLVHGAPFRWWGGAPGRGASTPWVPRRYGSGVTAGVPLLPSRASASYDGSSAGLAHGTPDAVVRQGSTGEVTASQPWQAVGLHRSSP